MSGADVLGRGDPQVASAGATLELRARWIMCIAGPAYAILLVGGLLATTPGPDPALPAATEAARMTAESGQVRWGALLGLLGVLAFGTFGVGTALLAQARNRHLLAALAAATAVTTTATWCVSGAALAASALAADAGLSPDVIIALGGHLHGTTLVAGFGTAGLTVLLACSSGSFGRLVTVGGVVVGAGSVVATGALLSSVLDRGPLGPAVAVAFFGLPLWAFAAGITERPRRAVRTSGG